MKTEDPKPNGKPGAGGDNPPVPAAFDDSEFFTSEGVTEDEEKDAIRSRARVMRYANWRAKKESEGAGDPKPDDKPKPKKKWYKE